jgi:hypothetical protein
MKIPEYDEYLELTPGTVMKDETVDGVRYIIMRGPCSLCCYLGIPSTNKLAGIDYSDYDQDIPFSCHGGITFSREGDGQFWPKGYWWVGWDYAHSGDQSFFDYRDQRYYNPNDMPWIVEWVEREVLEVIPEFKEWLEREG